MNILRFIPIKTRPQTHHPGDEFGADSSHGKSDGVSGNKVPVVPHKAVAEVSKIGNL